MVHLADSKKQLDSDTELLLSIARKHLCRDGNIKVAASGRTQCSTSLWTAKDQCPAYTDNGINGCFNPVPYTEILQPGGIYYGQNAVSKNLLVADQETDE